MKLAAAVKARGKYHKATNGWRPDFSKLFPVFENMLDSPDMSPFPAPPGKYSVLRSEYHAMMARSGLNSADITAVSSPFVSLVEPEDCQQESEPALEVTEDELSAEGFSEVILQLDNLVLSSTSDSSMGDISFTEPQDLSMASGTTLETTEDELSAEGFSEVDLQLANRDLTPTYCSIPSYCAFSVTTVIQAEDLQHEADFFLESTEEELSAEGFSEVVLHLGNEEAAPTSRSSSYELEPSALVTSFRHGSDSWTDIYHSSFDIETGYGMHSVHYRKTPSPRDPTSAKRRSQAREVYRVPSFSYATSAEWDLRTGDDW